MLSFDDGSNRNFHSYTKTFFFAKRFYIHKKQKKTILFTYKIPRALLSNIVMNLTSLKNTIVFSSHAKKSIIFLLWYLRPFF